MSHLRRKSRGSSVPVVLVALLCGLLLAACSSAAASTRQATPTAAKPRAAAGGVLTWAEQPGASPNFIFPLANGPHASSANFSDFQYFMFLPLYWFGVDGQPTLNTSLSLAPAPVYERHDTIAVVNLKHWRWSDGEPVDAQDVLFWMNMMRAEKQNWAAYVPGEFPDDITNVVATGKYQVTFYLNKSYNPHWFTYNQFSIQVTPVPEAWDITSPKARPGSGGCANYSYKSITVNPKTFVPTSRGARACAAVYDFLSEQSGLNPKNPSATNTAALTTFATNPLWQVVDGPWRLRSYTTDGEAIFVPNKSYSGPDRPRLAKFVELPFTSATAEYNALLAGAVDVGYIPFSEITVPAPEPGKAGPNNPSLKNKYKLESSYNWGINYFPLNFHSTGDHGAAGAIFRQLYFRQALQSLIDQPAYDLKIFRNYAIPTYGPVPIEPPTYASPQERKNPYPYNPSKSKRLLTSHGWHVVPEGTTICERPGVSATECGRGIRAGTPLSFTLQYESGDAALTELVSDEVSAWEEVGIHVSLTQATYDTVISNATDCTSGCPWEMEDWGNGWGYAPDYYPTGGDIFGPKAILNPSGYSNPTNTRLIAETHTSSSRAVFYEYQDFLAKQLPDVWQPTILSETEVEKDVNIGPLNIIGDISPAQWYFVKR